MKRSFLYLNVACYLSIAAFLAISLATALQSGYPWAVTCYNCMRCRRVCPLGFDPNGFISAAIVADARIYIPATNVRLQLAEAHALDTSMLLRHVDGRVRTADQWDRLGLGPDTELTVERMQARHAARFCPLCGSCDKSCPIGLPVTKIIEDLRDDGTFNRR
jgi:L-lactate utilization protein LutB